MMKTIRLAAWLLTAAVTLVFVTQPVSVGAQLALASTVIIGMVALWRFGRGLYARWLFLTLGSLVVMRYIFWRATYTLPPLDQPVNFALGLLLVTAELYCVLILMISLVINADPLDRKPLPLEPDAAMPTVDVFIPTYNEDEIILATTIAAARSMDYPEGKLKVWLLDDGGTDQKCGDANSEKAAAAKARRASLQALAKDLGAYYLTRAKNEHAKAGNMNNGLEHAKGEIIVVFDADHAPFKSFLRETVGHFAKDPKLFLVQTPHVFLNPDPIERNLKTWNSMPSENEMFYSVTQRGLDKWDGSFFCGSAALLRRAALDVAGGFSGITITEDCETAFELHAKGWHSAYVDKPLIAGLQPETFESFIGQRSRWCQGMFQILLLKNPLFKKGLKPIQKLAYLSSMTFWFFPLPRMIFTFAPLLHIFFDVKIFVSSMDEALAYTATYMVVNLMLQNYLYGRVRWPFISELYEYVQGVYLAKAIVSVVMSPRKPTFNVTAKGISLEANHLSSLAVPFFAIFCLLAAGSFHAFYRYFTQPGAELMLIVGLWTSFNLVIAGVALGVVAERREPDRFPRLGIARRGILRIGDARSEVAISSVSAGGCSLRFAEGAPPPAGLDAAGPLSLAVLSLDGRDTNEPLDIALMHTTTDAQGTTLGFVFGAMRPASYMTLADLMYGDPDAILRFQKSRRAHKNLLTGAWQFLRWGVLEPVRAFTYIGDRKAAHAAAPAKIALAPAAAADIGREAEPILAEVSIETVLLARPAVEAVAPVVVLAATRDDAAAPLKTVSVSSEAVTIDVDVSDAVVAADADFDALAARLSAAPTDDEIDVTADWMNALLTLAATEMKRLQEPEEQVDASSIAA
jgi:cellulose synthase (UDP-forming)